MARTKTPRPNSEKHNGEALNHTVTSVTADAVPEIREVRRTDARKNIVPINLDDEIRRRAYELWEQHGHESGHDEEHWLVAEREILARYHTGQRQHSA